MVVDALVHESVRCEKMAKTPGCKSPMSKLIKAESLYVVADKLCDALSAGDRRVGIIY